MKIITAVSSTVLLPCPFSIITPTYGFLFVLIFPLCFLLKDTSNIYFLQRDDWILTVLQGARVWLRHKEQLLPSTVSSCDDSSLVLTTDYGKVRNFNFTLSIPKLHIAGFNFKIQTICLHVHPKARRICHTHNASANLNPHTLWSHLQGCTVVWEGSSVCVWVNSLNTCISYGGINTFCCNVRMAGMGFLWQVIGPSLSVWPFTVVFVSGGNPVSEAERGGGVVAAMDVKKQQQVLTKCLETKSVGQK